MKRSLLSVAFLVLFGSTLFGQTVSNAPYQDPSLSPEKRAAGSGLTHDARGESSADAEQRSGHSASWRWRLQLVEEALHGVRKAAPPFSRAHRNGRDAWTPPWCIASPTPFPPKREPNTTRRSAIRRCLKCLRCSPGRIAGLTYWSPNINIFRDPRWGRGQETYGEDPFLTSRMGVAFVTGMQGDDPHYLKVVATPKHYAVHSGPEPLRHTFDAKPSQYDLENTYLPAFKAAIMEGKADSIMCVYNSVNGSPAAPTQTCCKSISVSSGDSRATL